MKINEIESISIGFESFSDYSYKFEEDNIRHLLLDKINSLEFRRTTEKDASVFLNEDVVFLHFMYFDNQDIHYMQLLVDEENIIMFDSFTHIKSYSIGDDYEEFNEFIELFREIGITEDIGL